MDSNLHTTPDTIKVLAHQQYDAPDALSPTTVLPNPLDQFRAWFTAAQGVVHEPEAMAVSTATPSGIPSSRILLLKQVDTRGFVFYTNYESRKSRELAANPHAALVFFWREVHRQVRILGRVERVTAEESEEYFRSRPVGSRVGAWASRQSTVVGEGDLQKNVEDVRERFGVKEGAVDADIPLPEFWGGWRVIPSEIEFWAGKPSRLHDRVRYILKEGASDESPEWTIERLSP
ncbi:pyridoxamine 5'-phosphate oxidase [Artomyces pyxidatus]|uniref:Pyridoxamine 5'-phosphate oxidase n=1 Tax=Artomyces pyxidatus TaxID=48021 RepID=A0ACB8SJD7_9AGAM|nr:pyridoxamine 5'-phosphate oxidase [Artomyces pyxidatus]